MEMKKQPIQPESLVGAEVWGQANRGQAANNGSGPTRLKTRSNGRVRKSKAALIKGEIRERRTKRGLTVT